MDHADTQEPETDVVENFYGVYLLYSINPKYKGRTYIGFTVNPNRRINQHNKGFLHGGAKHTNNRGPWEMVLIVHGFPNDVSALRFEWAWQHPHKSRRLRNVPKKKPRENRYQFCLRVLVEMLQVGPWCKLPLTVRWLSEQYFQQFQVDRCPPLHMPVTMGAVSTCKVTTASSTDPEDVDTVDVDCALCAMSVSTTDAVSCLSPSCRMHAHIMCLAAHFLGPSQDLLPLEGDCPVCQTHLLWGDVVRKKKGCYQPNSPSSSPIKCSQSQKSKAKSTVVKV